MGIFLASRPMGSFILTGLLPRRVRDGNTRVILWVMCVSQKFVTKLVKRVVFNSRVDASNHPAII